jgi:integrase
MAAAQRAAKRLDGEGSIRFDERKQVWVWRLMVGYKLNGKPDILQRSDRTQKGLDAKIKTVRKQLADRVDTAQRSDWTVATWIKHWVDTKKRGRVAPKTLAGYRTDLRCYIEPSGIGAIRLDKLTLDHVDELFTWMLTHGHLRSCPHLKRTLRAAIQSAVASRKIAENPIALAELPKVPPVTVTPLTADESMAVLARATVQRNAPRWRVALSIGLRQGEALGLMWDDIDWDTGVLTVQRQLQRLTWEHGCLDESACVHYSQRKKRMVPRRGADCPQRHGGGLVLAPTKGDKIRTIVLNEVMLDELREHKARQDAEREWAVDLWTENGMVFATQTGGYVDPGADRRAWVELVEAAGVHRARLHDARHTAATLLLNAGLDENTVMDVFGWSSSVLLRRYQHVTDPAKRAVADAMARTLPATTKLRVVAG